MFKWYQLRVFTSSKTVKTGLYEVIGTVWPIPCQYPCQYPCIAFKYTLSTKCIALLAETRFISKKKLIYSLQNTIANTFCRAVYMNQLVSYYWQLIGYLVPIPFWPYLAPYKAKPRHMNHEPGHMLIAYCLLLAGLDPLGSIN